MADGIRDREWSTQTLESEKETAVLASDDRADGGRHRSESKEWPIPMIEASAAGLRVCRASSWRHRKARRGKMLRILELIRDNLLCQQSVRRQRQLRPGWL